LAPVEAVPPVTGTRWLVPTWDDAIDACIAEGDGPARASDAMAQSPALASDPAVSPLESALLAGVAVGLWGTWEIQSRKDRRRWWSFRHIRL
jgi:hypothetical protein